MNLIDYADLFATRCHEGQFRKYTVEPYINHPRRVAKRMMDMNQVPSVIAAAYLHDVMEDCQVRYEQLEEYFNVAVADMVKALSKPSDPFYRAMNHTRRTQMDITRLSRSFPDVQNIKLVDRIDNLQDIEKADAAFRERYLNESIILCDYLSRGKDELRSELYTLIETKQGA